MDQVEMDVLLERLTEVMRTAESLGDAEGARVVAEAGAMVISDCVDHMDRSVNGERSLRRRISDVFDLRSALASDSKTREDIANARQYFPEESTEWLRNMVSTEAPAGTESRSPNQLLDRTRVRRGQLLRAVRQVESPVSARWVLDALTAQLGDLRQFAEQVPTSPTSSAPPPPTSSQSR